MENPRFIGMSKTSAPVLAGCKCCVPSSNVDVEVGVGQAVGEVR